MKALYCDVCRKELVDAITERTYWNIREYEICEICKESIELKLRKLLRSHIPFTQDYYEHELMLLIEKSVAARHA